MLRKLTHHTYFCRDIEIKCGATLKTFRAAAPEIMADDDAHAENVLIVG